jgi:hypothetical protein
VWQILFWWMLVTLTPAFHETQILLYKIYPVWFIIQKVRYVTSNIDLIKKYNV